MANRRKFKYLESETQTRFISAIRAGSSYAMACQYAGFSDETWARVRRAASSRRERGQEDDPLVAFVDAVARAEAESYMVHLAAVNRAANGAFDRDGNAVREPDWRAAAWKLEKRFPQDFGRSALEISGPKGGPIVTEAAPRRLPPLPDDTLDEILRDT